MCDGRGGGGQKNREKCGRCLWTAPKGKDPNVRPETSAFCNWESETLREDTKCTISLILTQI